MEQQRDDKFTFTWIIENFSIMCHQSDGGLFHSPGFILNSLPDMKWHIGLKAKSYTCENYIEVFLARYDDVKEDCNVRYTIEVLDCNEKLIFNYNGKNVVVFGTKTSSWYYTAFVEKWALRSLINDILVVKYTVEPVCETNQQGSLPQLSFKNGFFTDILLRAGDAVFKVHKAILLVRWPKLVEQLDAEEVYEQALDIRPDVLEAMINYVYTGKLDYSNPELLVEIYAAATKYELPNLRSIPDVAQKWRTRINIKKILFEWPIKNFSSLPINTVLYSHVFSVDILESCRWNLIFYMSEDATHCRNFDITISKVYDDESKPIFLRSKISFSETISSENEHLFKMDKKWKCAEFSRSISTDPNDVLLLKCEFNFSDCNYFSENVERFCAFTSSINCRYFRNDFRSLFKTGKLSDVSIIIGSKTFPAHKSVLCARSSVFCRMFQTQMSESEKNTVVITDVDPGVMDELLMYMYSGYLEKPLEETAEQLYTAADKYDFPALKEKCSSFLKSHLSAKNVSKVVQLADLHSDNDLYESVLDFSCAHAKDVFSANEWKEFMKDSMMGRLLHDVLLRNK